MLKMENNKKNITNAEIENAVIEFKNGSVEAFTLLYSVFSKPIYRFCFRILNDEESAQDAYQETFIRVYERRQTFNGTNFGSWVYAIAHNTCINYIRKRKHTQSIGENDYGFHPKHYLKIGLREHIAEQISKLPLSLQEAVVLKDMEGLPYKDVAEILGIDLSLAKVRVLRARLRLKELLEPIMKELNETA